MIWFKPYELSEINSWSKNTLLETLDIQLTEITKDSLLGELSVGPKVHQPMGLLHGGINCVLAETLGSILSNLVLDRDKFYAVGLEINTNHIRSIRSGTLKGLATPIHLGRTTHVIDIKTFDEDQKLTSISRLTNAILPRS